MVIKKKDMENERNRFISEGGKISPPSAEWTTICLRINKRMLNHVDEAVIEAMQPTRTTWILEAIREKLGLK